MLKKERQAYILHQVNLHNKVLSSLLSQEITGFGRYNPQGFAGTCMMKARS